MPLSWYPVPPPWDAVHPALVQFPLALLFAAPLLVAVAVVAGRAWRSWAAAALLLMAAGTFTLWLAASAGHAAGQLVDKTPAIARAIARHEALGLEARGVFTALTAAFALLLGLPLALKRELPARWRTPLLAGFLAAYVACTGVLAHTADAGGRLVHHDGLRAMVGPPDSAVTSAPVVSAETSPVRGRLR